MTKKKAEEYVNEYIKHIINFQMYGNKFCKTILKYRNQTVNKIYRMLMDSSAFVTKTSCNTIRSKIGEELDSLTDKITNHIIEQVALVTQYEGEWIETVLSEFLEVYIYTKDIDQKKLLSAPVAYAGIIEDFGKNFVNKYRSFFFDIIAASYITGSSFEELKESFKARKNAIDRGVKAEAETLGSSLGTQYDRIVFTRNSKKFTGFIWSAILDTSTCLVCGELNGKVYHDITKAPMYPVHPRCRCILIPFTEDILDYIPESYSSWFERQSEEDKIAILGKERYQLYKKGLQIKDFVNNGQITPLKALKSKNSF